MCRLLTAQIKCPAPPTRLFNDDMGIVRAVMDWLGLGAGMAVLCKVAGAKSRNKRHRDAARPSRGRRNVTIPI